VLADEFTYVFRCPALSTWGKCGCVSSLPFTRVVETAGQVWPHPRGARMPAFHPCPYSGILWFLSAGERDATMELAGGVQDAHAVNQDAHAVNQRHALTTLCNVRGNRLSAAPPPCPLLLPSARPWTAPSSSPPGPRPTSVTATPPGGRPKRAVASYNFFAGFRVST